MPHGNPKSTNCLKNVTHSSQIVTTQSNTHTPKRERESPSHTHTTVLCMLFSCGYLIATRFWGHTAIDNMKICLLTNCKPVQAHTLKKFSPQTNFKFSTKSLCCVPCKRFKSLVQFGQIFGRSYAQNNIKLVTFIA